MSYQSELKEGMKREELLGAIRSMDYLYILDQNSGQYSSNQVQFQTSAWSNNRKPMLYSEGYIAMPMNILVTSSADFGLSAGLAATIKGASYSFVDYVNIVLNGKTVSNNSRGAGILSHFKNMLDMSANKLAMYGPSILFSPDSVQSTRVKKAGARSNVVNNIIVSTGAVEAYDYLNALEKYNSGAKQRALWISQTEQTTLDNSDQVPITNQQLSNLGRNRKVSTNSLTTAYNLMLHIRLTDIHDIFKKLDFPMVNANFQIYINIVQGEASFSAEAGQTLGVTTTSQSSGLYTPIMLTSGTTNLIDNPAKIVTVKYGIGDQKTGVESSGTSQTSCRLYVPQVSLDPEVELMSLRQKRRVYYCDHQIFNIGDLRADVNWAITNGIQNLKRLWFLPMYSLKGSVVSQELVQRQFSLVASEPFSSSYNTALSNIQLVLNGKNFYSNTIRYSWEEFLHNVNTETIQGGSDDSVAAGLYDFDTFQRCPVYLFDVRRNPDIISPDVPVSVQLIANVSSPVSAPVDLWCFAEYENRIDLDMQGESLIVL